METMTSATRHGSSPASAEPRNLVEPAWLVSAFLANPPRGFSPCLIGEADAELPGFITEFDLTTTLDAPLKGAAARLPGWLRRVMRPRVLFAGTTVTEYLPVPAAVDPSTLVQSALRQAARAEVPLVILKDIPRDSPLLGADDNEAAARLREACRAHGFVIVSGQALAYVPLDFPSEAAYLAALTRGRRKDLRRKLRTRAELEVEELRSGDRALGDDALLDELVRLYANVYAQSVIHFDELTRPFLESLFRGEDGILFLYRRGGVLIGFNLCFVHRGRLVDKYVGFSYPAARDANLYFVSWFHNLEWARRHGLREYVAGWTDPEVKSALGARFTFTDHAVYLRHRGLRFALRLLRRWFESDASLVERLASDARPTTAHTRRNA
jgi:hypothetical protein